MATSIDNRIVEMKFDNKDFEKGAQETLNTLDKLKKSLQLDGAEKGFKELDKAAKEVDFSSIEQSVNKLEYTFTNFFGITGRKLIEDFAEFGVKKIEGFVSAINNSFITGPIKSGWSRYEEEAASVATIFNATKDAAKSDEENLEIVMKSMDKLMWYTDETSAKYSDMVNNIGKFTAAGVKLDTAVDAMMGISNWAYLSGQNVQSAGRVMYNMAQALGMGKMTLLDWKSIELANMATKEFKEQALEAGVAAGTLYKVADKYYDKVKKTEVTAEAIRESLQTGWFNKDVMLRVLSTYGEFGSAVKEYIDSHEGIDIAVEAMEAMEKEGIAIGTIGERAFKAAQEAKTFREAWDATIEAVTTGWSKSFRIIFGDYLQAKKIWSELSETLYTVFAEPGNIRNAWLTEVFQVPQSLKKSLSLGDFINIKSFATNSKLGFGSATFGSAFNKLLYNTAKKNGIPIDEFIKKKGSLMHTLSEGWLTGDLFKDALQSISDLENGVTGVSASFEELDKIAKQVEYGTWYNGQKRKDLLTKAGYDYELVQSIVNHDLLGWELDMNKFNNALAVNQEYTAAEIDALIKFKKAAEEAGTPIEELLDELDTVTGRDMAIESVKNIFHFMEQVAGVVKNAVSETVGVIDAFSAWIQIRNFRNFTRSLKLTETTAKNLQTILTTVFKILKARFITIPLRLIKTFSPLLSILESLGRIMLSFGSLFAKFIDKLIGSETLANKSDSLFNWIHDKLQAIAEWMEKVADKVEESASKFEDFFNMLKQQEGIKRLLEQIKELGTWLFEKLGLGKAKDELDEFAASAAGFTENITMNHIVKAFDTVAGYIATAVEKVREFFSALSLENLKGTIFEAENGIANFFGTMFQSEDLKTDILDFLEWVKTTLTEFFTNLFNGTIIGQLKQSFENVKTSFNTGGIFGLSSTLLGYASKGFENLIRLGGKLASIFKKDNKEAKRMSRSVQQSTGHVNAILKPMASVRGLMVARGYVDPITGEEITGSSTDWSGVIRFFEELWQALQKYVPTIGGIVDWIIPKLQHFVDNITLQKLLNFFYLGAATKLLRSISKFFGGLFNLSNTVRGNLGQNKNSLFGNLINIPVNLAQLPNHINKLMDNLGKAAIRSTSNPWDEQLLHVAEVVGIVAASLKLISDIPQDNLDHTIEVMQKIVENVAGVAAVLIFGSETLNFIKTKINTNNLKEIEPVTGLMNALTTLLKNVNGTISNFKYVGIGVAILAFMGAVYLMRYVVEWIINWDITEEQIKDNIHKFVIVFAMIGAIVGLFSGLSKIATINMAGMGIGFAAIIGALWLFTLFFDKLKEVASDEEGVKKSLTFIAWLGVAFIPLFLAFSIDGAVAGKSAMGLLSMIIAMRTLVALVQTINEMSAEELRKGFGVVTGIIAMFIVLQLIAVFASRNAGSFKFFSGTDFGGLGAALLEIAFALKLIAGIDGPGLFKAVTVLGIIMAALAFMVNSVGTVAMATRGSGFVQTIGIILALGAMVFAIAGVIGMIIEIKEDPNVLLKKVGAISLLLVAVGGLLWALGSLPKGGAFKGVVAFGLAFVELMAVVWAVGEGMRWIEENWGGDALQSFIKVGEVIGGAIGGFIAGLAAGIDAIEQLTGVDIPAKFTTLGEAIGGLVGGFIGGIGEGMTEKLPEIANNITNFFESMKNAVEVLKGMDTGEEGMPSVFDWIRGDKKGNSLADKVDTLAYVFSRFSYLGAGTSGLYSIDWPTLQNTLNNMAGLLEVWQNATIRINKEDAEKSGAAIEALVTALDKLPTDGFKNVWEGFTDYEGFASGMEALGTGLYNFSSKVAVMGSRWDAVYAAADALERFAGLGKLIGNNSDNWSFNTLLFGQTDLDQFGTDLAKLGQGLADFSAIISGADLSSKTKAGSQNRGVLGLDINAVDTAVDALTKLAGTLDLFDHTNSIVDTLQGKATLATVGQGLTNFAKGFDALKKSMTDWDYVTFEAFKTGVIDVLASENWQQIYAQVGNLKKNIVDELENVEIAFVDLVTSMTMNLYNGFIIGGSMDSTTGMTSMSTQNLWATAATKVLAQIIKGLTDTTADAGLHNAGTEMANEVADKLKEEAEPGHPIYEAGVYAGLGFAHGMTSDESILSVTLAAQALAQVANDQLRWALDEHSPSKLTEEAGIFFGQGLANGMVLTTGTVATAATTVAASAIDGLRNTMSSLADFVFDEVDTEPTIKPVLDLSNVQASSKQIGNLLNSGRGLSVSGTATIASSTASSWNSQNQNAQDSANTQGNNISFIQNNYSPKALSRIEIYRQTHNQFAAVKEALGK